MLRNDALSYQGNRDMILSSIRSFYSDKLNVCNLIASSPKKWQQNVPIAVSGDLNLVRKKCYLWDIVRGAGLDILPVLSEVDNDKKTTPRLSEGIVHHFGSQNKQQPQWLASLTWILQTCCVKILLRVVIDLSSD